VETQPPPHLHPDTDEHDALEDCAVHEALVGPEHPPLNWHPAPVQVAELVLSALHVAVLGPVQPFQPHWASPVGAVVHCARVRVGVFAGQAIVCAHPPPLQTQFVVAWQAVFVVAVQVGAVQVPFQVQEAFPVSGAWHTACVIVVVCAGQAELCEQPPTYPHCASAVVHDVCVIARVGVGQAVVWVHPPPQVHPAPVHAVWVAAVEQARHEPVQAHSGSPVGDVWHCACVSDVVTAGHAVVCAQAPVQRHCGSPVGDVWHCACVVAAVAVGQEFVCEHVPLKLQPAVALQVLRVVAVQVGAEHPPLQPHPLTFVQSTRSVDCGAVVQTPDELQPVPDVPPFQVHPVRLLHATSSTCAAGAVHAPVELQPLPDVPAPVNPQPVVVVHPLSVW
jgi:hypothetical protein